MKDALLNRPTVLVPLFPMLIEYSCIYYITTHYKFIHRAQLAAQACYDPEAAVRVFEKLGAIEKKMGGGRIPSFLRTHPVSTTRIERIKAVCIALRKREYVMCGFTVLANRLRVCSNSS